MPKIRRTEQNVRDDNFRAIISGSLEKVHISRTELAERAGINRTTMSRRWQCPDEFTKGELRNICNILNISPNTLLGGDAF